MGTFMPDPTNNTQGFPLAEHNPIQNRPNMLIMFFGRIVNNFHLEGTVVFYAILQK